MRLFTTGGLEIYPFANEHLSTVAFQLEASTDQEKGIMASTSRRRTCKICGLSDGHTLIDCPFKCTFCGKSAKSCACQDSSLVEEIRNSDELSLGQEDGSSTLQPPAKKENKKDR